MSGSSVAAACRQALRETGVASVSIRETEAFDPTISRADRAGPAPSPPWPPDPWILSSVPEALGELWPTFSAALGRAEGTPRLLARAGPSTRTTPYADLAGYASLPGTVVLAPADARRTRAAVQAIARRPGPAYVRLPPDGPELPGGPEFALGRAAELRGGHDLTIWAVGAALAPALALAERLHAVGLEARVLDGESVKPLDVAAAVRAARETGAILTVEEHPALYGAGAAVAAVVAGSHPVPVRRVGFPDLMPGSATPGAAFAIPPARLDEEAWELLKAKGKVQ